MKNSKMNWRLPKRDRTMPVKLFGDMDKDKVANVFDCRPNNRRKQGFLFPVKYPKKVNRYLPQIQTITNNMLIQQEKDNRKLREYYKKAYSRVGTRGQKEKADKMKHARQAEDTGLFDFISIPGIVAKNEHISSVPDQKEHFRKTYKEKKMHPMNLIIEKGIVKGEIVTKRRSPDTIELKSIYILPEYRNQGLGKKVVRSLFKNPNTKKITGVAIPQAQEYWEKMGARQTGSSEEMAGWDDHIEQSAEAIIRELGNRPDILDKHKEELAMEAAKSGWPNTLEKEEFEKQDAQDLIDEVKKDD